MSPLGQTEAFDPAPTRRLVVRPGQTAYWGVDPSTLRVSCATIDADGARGASTESFPGGEGGERLASIFERTAALATELVDSGFCYPGVIVVEQPSGKRENPALSYAVGVIQAAFASVCGVRVETVSSGTWKKVACGYGAIYKPKSMADGEYGVLEWARTAGYGGSSWDEADAWGIAEYARKTFLLEVR